MSNDKNNRLKKMLQDLKNAGLEPKSELLFPHKFVPLKGDPRLILLDPETTNREEYERHSLLCEDLNLLKELDIDDEDYY
jgi:hypothetical protein